MVHERPGTPSRVYLVRHGETAWSLSGRHTGRTDVALTACGEDQARALEPGFGKIRFDHVLTSPAQRARRTCTLAGLGDTAVVEPDLAEWDYGAYEGELSSAIREGRPGWTVYRDGCPGGEAAGDVAIRADRLIARLCCLGGNVALFSHGQFGCSLGVRWIGLPVAQGRHFQLGTASFCVLGFNPSHPELPVIAQWNISPVAADGRRRERYASVVASAS